MLGRRNASVMLLCAGLAGVACGFFSRGDEPTLMFLSVGQGDCVVLRSEGRTMVIDSGPNETVAERAILPKLRQMGVDRIDLLLVSHPDTDHTGGLRVLQPRADRVLMSSAFRDHPQIMENMGELGKVTWLQRETHVRVGDCRVLIKPPQLELGEGDNEGSPLVRVEHGASSALLFGDAGLDTENEMLNLGRRWQSDILQAGHHGSAGSTGTPWLAAVQPRYVVISCGRKNLYGHPSPRALERIQQSGAQTLLTAEDGDVTFRLQASGPELQR